MYFHRSEWSQKKAQICNQKEKRVNGISLERKYKEVSKVAIWWPPCLMPLLCLWMDGLRYQNVKVFN